MGRQVAAAVGALMLFAALALAKKLSMSMSVSWVSSSFSEEAIICNE